MVNGLIFDERYNTAKNWGNILHRVMQKDGVMCGCGITRSGNNVIIDRGYFIACGRIVEIETPEEIKIEMPQGFSNGYVQLCYEIDLSKAPSSSAFTQGEWATHYSEGLMFDSLKQHNINNDETEYQIEFAVFQVAGGALGSISRSIAPTEINADTVANNTIEQIIQQGIERSLLKAYPVGSIYMSTNSANPATLFGGTWSLWGAGRVPVGINTGDADFSTVEKTGGAKTHTHTSASHTHTSASHTHTSASHTHTIDAHTHGITGLWAAITNNLSPYTYIHMERGGSDGSGNYNQRIACGASENISTKKPTSYPGVRIAGSLSSAASSKTGSTTPGATGSTTPGATGSTTPGATGASSALQPYITCYMWKRTA